MKLKIYFIATLFFFFGISFAQYSVTEIQTKSGSTYITSFIDYPIDGTYLFNGGEPIVQLNANGTGFYQLHGQEKRPVIWGFECLQRGEPKFLKGFNSSAYTIWYQYTDIPASDPENEWKFVEFTIHFNTLKMFIQGERMKRFELKEKE
jgi:hypothetical protein